MQSVEVWKANVKAQEILIDQYSEPFEIQFKSGDSDKDVRFNVITPDPRDTISNELREAFPGINMSDVHIDEGYLLYDSQRQPIQIAKLKEFAESNYFDFSEDPCFSGRVILQDTSFNFLDKAIGKNPNRYGELFATLSEIEVIDEALKLQSDVSREPSVGAVFKVQPSRKYIEAECDRIMSYIHEVVNLNSVYTNGYFHNVVIENAFLKSQALEYIRENSAYLSSHHRIIFKINQDVFDSFLLDRKRKNVFFSDEDHSKSKKGFILPKPENNEFHIVLNGLKSLEEVRYEIVFYQKVFGRYFEIENIEVSHLHIFQQDDSKFFDLLEGNFASEKFNVSRNFSTISFDFQHENEFQSQLGKLMSLDLLEIDYRGESHCFKVQMNFHSPLLKIQENLAQIPAVDSKISDSKKELLFFCFFQNQELLQLLRARVADVLDKVLPSKVTWAFDELEQGKLKYFLNFKKEEFENELRSKFNHIVGEDVVGLNQPILSDSGASKKVEIGTITRADYPFLSIRMADIPVEAYAHNDSLLVQCQLKGEKDKIKRLSDTVDIIFSDKDVKIPNNKLRSILIDSSKAESYEGDVCDYQDYKMVREDVRGNFLSEHINERQLEAISKSLLAEDVFMIQGPPGTGKSTAIAELIWQHLRSNNSNKRAQYRVLVTSETNLAVDNALDKLRSKEHVLIKPIRFGTASKLDKEGRRFSIERLKVWKDIGHTDDNLAVDPIIIKDWISMIHRRAQNRKSSRTEALVSRWERCLMDESSLVREVFYDNYVKNCNVIGSTCSSIGKVSSTGKFTRFFTDYCSVVYPSEHGRFVSSYSGASIQALKAKDIVFDLVIQDEASKASPPELALPCLFGKKVIIIGDHRQLPPMVDPNEFLENLNLLAKRTKIEDYRKEIKTLVRYVKSNRAEFLKSHFESLFYGINANLKTTFNTQYRMHPGINDTIEQFYIDDGGLKCGIPIEIANSKDLSHPLNRYHGLGHKENTHVVWMDVNSPEFKKGTSRINFGEIKTIDWVLNSFNNNPKFKSFLDHWPEDEIEQRQVGIITFYEAQSSELEKLKSKYPEIPLRISPVDRFQGMERNIVIVSLVRSNSISQFPDQPPNFKDFPESGFPQQDSLGFAESPNRLNVALSRAKRLLIVVGNSKHFRKHEIYNRVYETIANSSYGSIREVDYKKL
jgi:DNA polymerase alpha-associated DNA helicase A